MKKVAVVFNSDFETWPIGGTLTYLRTILPELSQKYKIELWGCTIDKKFSESVIIANQKFQFYTCANVKTKKKIIPNYFRCLWGNFCNAKRILKQNYDLIYFHLGIAEIGFLCGSGKEWKKLTPKILLHQHGMAYPTYIQNKIEYIAQNRADKVFFTTNKLSLEKHAKRAPQAKITWMPSMVDEKYFKPLSTFEREKRRKNLGINEPVFIYTGRITSWKSPLLLLEAFQKFQTENKGNGLLIYIGTGDQLPILTKIVKEKNLQQKVKLLREKSQQEILEWLQISDVFVMPSQGEGVSLSTLEALATNVPVVAFDVEGMQELIQPRNGILLKNRTANCLKDGMKRVLNLSDLEPRTSIKSYYKEKVIKDMILEIDFLLNNVEHL